MRSTVLCVLLSVAFTGISFAADSTAVLTIDQCIDTALRHNFGVISAKNLYDASRGSVYAAWGAVLPSISTSAGVSSQWPVRGGGYYNPATGRFYSGKYVYSGQLGFDVAYPGLGLFTYANIRQKYHDRSSSLYSLRSARSNLALKIKGDYYAALKAKMLAGVSQDAVKRSEEGLRVAQSRYDLGSASMSDVLRARVQLGNDKVTLVTQQNAFKLALSNLAFDMGRDVNQEFEIAERLPERSVEAPFENALQEALSNNPDYRKATFDLASAKDQVMQASAAFLPSLSLSLSHSTAVGGLNELLDFKGFSAGRRYGATLSFNIFNNGSDYAALTARRKLAQTSEENLVNTRNNVALSLKQAFLNLQQAEETRKLADDAVSSAQEDLNLVKEKYNLGAATILDVMDAEVTFRQAQTNQVQALFDYNLAVAQLENAMGR